MRVGAIFYFSLLRILFTVATLEGNGSGKIFEKTNGFGKVKIKKCVCVSWILL